MVPLYRIRDWGKHFENNQTRVIRGRLPWIRLPTDHDGLGYCTLALDCNSGLHLGAWVSLLQLAARCNPRGTLAKSDGSPLSIADISSMTRISIETYEQSIPRLMSVGWLEVAGVEPEAEVGFRSPESTGAVGCNSGLQSCAIQDCSRVRPDEIRLDEMREHTNSRALGVPESVQETGIRKDSPSPRPVDAEPVLLGPRQWGPEQVRSWWNSQAQILEVPGVSRVTDRMLEDFRARCVEFGDHAVLEALPNRLNSRPSRFRIARLPGFSAVFESEDAFRKVIDAEKYATEDLDKISEKAKAAETEAAERARAERQRAEQLAARTPVDDLPEEERPMSREELGRMASDAANRLAPGRPQEPRESEVQDRDEVPTGGQPDPYHDESETSAMVGRLGRRMAARKSARNGSSGVPADQPPEAIPEVSQEELARRKAEARRLLSEAGGGS